MADHLGSYTNCNNCGELLGYDADKLKGEAGTIVFDSLKRGKRTYRLCGACMLAMLEELLWSKANE